VDVMVGQKVTTQVLIVEDNDQLREFLRAQLEFYGYQPTATGTGESALELAIRECPDVILLDINLPGIDGFETLKRLRAMPSTRDVPVILLTERSANQDVITGYNMGAAYYVPKPFRLDDLVHGIQIALS
jgi:DNA-binding response OmpR family regulator